MTTQLKRNNNINLPQSIVDELGLGEGDDFLIEVRDGRITLIPAITIPRDEAYLFTPEWQQKLREAEEDIREGRVHEAADVEKMFEQLDRE